MGNSYALIIAIESYADKTIQRVRFAENDANGIVTTVVELGYDRRDINLLLSSAATKTTIESAARICAKMLQADDTVFIFYAGHGFASGGHNYITAYDTNPKDAVPTSIQMQWLFDVFRKTPCKRVMFFLDCCHSGLPLAATARTFVETMSDDELRNYFEGAEFHAVFAACRMDEVSHGSFQFQHGFWTYHLIQALTGEEPRVISRNGFVTSADLQDYLRTVVPRDVKLQHTTPTTQNPVVFGNVSGTFAIADLSPVLAKKAAQAQAAGFEHGVLRGEKSGRVVSLSGFNKAAGHTAPKLLTKRTQSWVAGLAKGDLDTEMEKRFQQIRATGHYDGDDVEYDPPSDGGAAIRTPDFHFTISYQQDESDPSQYVEARELTRLDNEALLSENWFNDLFKGDFDDAVIAFSGALDVADFVSRVDGKVQGARCDFDAKRTYCTLRFPGMQGSITVTADALTYHLGGHKSPGEIVRGLQDAQGLMLQAPQIQKALPL